MRKLTPPYACLFFIVCWSSWRNWLVTSPLFHITNLYKGPKLFTDIQIKQSHWSKGSHILYWKTWAPLQDHRVSMEYLEVPVAHGYLRWKGYILLRGKIIKRETSRKKVLRRQLQARLFLPIFSQSIVSVMLESRDFKKEYVAEVKERERERKSLNC